MAHAVVDGLVGLGTQLLIFLPQHFEFSLDFIIIDRRVLSLVIHTSVSYHNQAAWACISSATALTSFWMASSNDLRSRSVKDCVL